MLAKFASVFILSLLFTSLHSGLQAQEDISITATTFEVDGKKNMIIASGNVTINKGVITILGNKAYYKELNHSITIEGQVNVTSPEFEFTCEHLVLSGKTNEIAASKNLNFKFNEIQGTSKKALYNISKKVIKLSENVRISRHIDTLEGQTVFFHLATNEIKTVGKTVIFLSPERFQ